MGARCSFALRVQMELLIRRERPSSPCWTGACRYIFAAEIHSSKRRERLYSDVLLCGLDKDNGIGQRSV